MTSSLYIGLMSGTSMDAVDCVLVDCADKRPRVIDFLCADMDQELKGRLLYLISNRDLDLGKLGNADIDVARLFAQTTNRLLARNHLDASAVAAIGSHGQTIWHEPPRTARPHAFTIQIGDPNTLAELTGITVVADFRRKDMAAGGQGAPIVPAFHRELLSSSVTDRIILNLGGIANITLLPRSQAVAPQGLDTGTASVLMDAWISRHHGLNYDDGGNWALTGKVDALLLQALLNEDYFNLPAPKSTGRELFNLAWLDAKLSQLPLPPAPEDVQATLLEFTVSTISDEILKLLNSGEVLACGGGARNTALMSRLQQKLPGFAVQSTSTHGIDADHVEAIAFAWLAHKTMRREAVDFSPFTGARHPVIAGGVYYCENFALR